MLRPVPVVPSSATLLVSLLLSLTLPCSAQASCTPTVQWTWDGQVRSPDRPLPTGSPVVVQLTDDDADGRITIDDVPDVAFIHCSEASIQRCTLTALDGASGADLFSVTDLDVLPMALAAGDLDGDGIVELVGVQSNLRFAVAFDNRGEVLWEGELPEEEAIGALVSLADLNGDGSGEVILGATVLGGDGALRWDGSAGRGRVRPFQGKLSSAVELEPESPGLELLAGNTLYASDGSVLWQRDDLPDGWTAVGDLDGDGVPELLLVGYVEATGESFVHVLDPDGVSLSAPLFVGTREVASPATIGDLNGDGRPEYLLSLTPTLRAMQWNGSELSELWTHPVVDPGCCVGVTVFDLDGDGGSEVLVRDTETWQVLEAATGAVLESTPVPSQTFIEMPTVVELDHDGLLELLIMGQDGQGSLTAYECAVPAPARCIWNEIPYHVTNVEDDGRLPEAEEPPWRKRDGWRVQSPEPCGGCRTCEDLLETLEEQEDLAAGIRRSLEAKAEAACRAEARDQPKTAGNVLCAFLHEIDAQDGQRIVSETARRLRECAWELSEELQWPMLPCVP